MKFLPFIILFGLLLSGCGGKTAFNRGEIASSFGNSGYQYFTKGQFDKSLVQYMKALKESEKNDIPALRARYLFNIGRVYYEMGIPDSARTYFLKSGFELSYYGDSVSSSMATGFIALVFCERGHIDSAKLLCKQQYSEDIKPLRHFWQMVRSRIAFSEHEYDKAIMLIDSASVYYRKSRDYEALVSAHFHKAEIQYERQLYSEVQSTLESALVYLEKTESQYNRWKVLLLLSKAYFKTGNERDGTVIYLRAKDCAPSPGLVPSLAEIQFDSKSL